jgi:hypothetical protein
MVNKPISLDMTKTINKMADIKYKVPDDTILSQITTFLQVLKFGHHPVTIIFRQNIFVREKR